ncbi:hypothetical protein Cgig2_003585 [Carnegiea gigantea]|uniref:Replication factor A C-terminal domain-containing protein n=1 Tax=Carnegiea gigantea TaxID=171969 RepID=A0A9Q1JHM0_9CARY|nr:hypothetical protein Cgig2_003585 [Carnegiea gigantea]
MKIATLDDTFTGISEYIFFCAARILDFVATKKSWYYYMSCECQTQLSNSGGGFYCPKCDITTQEPISRYRIETKVEDDGGATIFNLFDKKAEKLIGQSCSMLYDIEGSNDKDDNGGPQIPALIKNLIGTGHDILDNKEDKVYTFPSAGKENGVTQEKRSETKGVVAERNKSMIIDEEEETLSNTNQNGEATIIKKAKLK